MDANLSIAANTSTVVSFGKTLAGACVRICAYEPSRKLLVISSRNSNVLFQTVPPGEAFDPSIPLIKSISLPSAGLVGGTIVLNQADHGPLVQNEWWVDIDAGSLDWTVIEVLDMGCHGGQPPIDLFQGLSGGRGGDDSFSMGGGITKG